MPCTINYVYYTVCNLIRSNIVKGEFSKNFHSCFEHSLVRKVCFEAEFPSYISQNELNLVAQPNAGLLDSVQVCLHASTCGH